MSTATAEPTGVQAIVQQPKGTVLFLAKRSYLRLVHTGRYPVVVPQTGQRLGETSGVVVPFLDGRFECPESGEVTLMDPGGTGEAKMDAAELLAFLRSHPRCGDPNEGFIEVAPTIPLMNKEEHEAIVQAATDLDDAALAAIVEQERAGFNRDEVLELAEGARQRVVAAKERVLEEGRTQASSQKAQLDAAEERARKAEELLAAAQAAAGKPKQSK